MFNDLHSAHKPRPVSTSARPAMPFVNQERLVLKFPIFEQRTSTGSEPFSLLIRLDATKCVLLRACLPGGGGPQGSVSRKPQ